MNSPDASVQHALVLAVDAELRDMAFDVLTRAGYRVDAVGDVPSGTKRLAKDSYDLVVHDCDVPPPASTVPGREGHPSPAWVRVEADITPEGLLYLLREL